MSAPAAISASLVSMKNVGVHKSVALTIHVPEENARSVIDVFGWPTMTNPVPVAIARLNETPDRESAGQDGGASSQSRAGTITAPPSERKKTWHEKPASQQAALRCKDPRFQEWMGAEGDEEEAARRVRIYCCVLSRGDIDDSRSATERWRRLDGDFLVQTGQMAEPR